ncbi:MAG TPA: hypothetical protein VGL13_01360, partial [Polyangiaceae bacterium]
MRVRQRVLTLRRCHRHDPPSRRNLGNVLHCRQMTELGDSIQETVEKRDTSKLNTAVALLVSLSASF